MRLQYARFVPSCVWCQQAGRGMTAAGTLPKEVRRSGTGTEHVVGLMLHMGVMSLAKYLWCASYTTKGVKGLLKEGGTGRREAVEKLVADLGGSIESFYF